MRPSPAAAGAIRRVRRATVGTCSCAFLPMDPARYLRVIRTISPHLNLPPGSQPAISVALEVRGHASLRTRLDTCRDHQLYASCLQARNIISVRTSKELRIPCPVEHGSTGASKNGRAPAGNPGARSRRHYRHCQPGPRGPQHRGLRDIFWTRTHPSFRAL